jgi:hypothetical protein
MNNEGLSIFQVAAAAGGGGGGGGGSGTVTSVETDNTLTGGPITTTGTLGVAPYLTNQIESNTDKLVNINRSGETTTVEIGEGGQFRVFSDGGMQPSVFEVDNGLARVGVEMVTNDITPEINNAKDLGSTEYRWRDGYFSQNLYAQNIYSSSYDLNSTAVDVGANTAKLVHISLNPNGQAGTMLSENTTANVGTSGNFIVENGDGGAGSTIMLVADTAIRIKRDLVTDKIATFADGYNDIGQVIARFRDGYFSGNLVCGNLESSSGFNFNATATLAANSAINIGELEQKTSTLFVNPPGSPNTVIDDNVLINGEINIRNSTPGAIVASLIIEGNGGVETNRGGYFLTNCPYDTDDFQASISTAGGVSIAKDLSVPTINKLTAVGGVYSGLSDGAPIVTTGSLVPLTGIGSLIFPANTLGQGDTFHLCCAGDIAYSDRNDTLSVTLFNGATVLCNLIVDLENSSNESFFELEADLQYRSSGSAVTNMELTFNRNITSNLEGTRKITVVNSAIDYSVPNELLLTAVITGGASSIRTRLFYLQKVY